ncbi:PASTA domain-containing protein [Pyrinomonas sp.]|uniref:PASTA domain-containing protein n=1 Tax=Pyrinomonas sp. TaxID=2080306 RepID=UPI0033279A91
MRLAVGRLVIALMVGAMFLVGLVGTVYLSLRSPEVSVPNLVGRNRWDGEAELEKVGLKMRVRVTRPSLKVKPDTILDQSPRAGEVVKAGQTIAVVVSRTPIGNEIEALKESEKAAQEAAAQPTPMLENTNRERRRPNRNANQNANQNANGNANLNVNANRRPPANANEPARNVNANRSGANVNARPAEASRNVNANRSGVNANRPRSVTNSNQPPRAAEPVKRVP